MRYLDTTTPDQRVIGDVPTFLVRPRPEQLLYQNPKANIYLEIIGGMEGGSRGVGKTVLGWDYGKTPEERQQLISEAYDYFRNNKDLLSQMGSKNIGQIEQKFQDYFRPPPHAHPSELDFQNEVARKAQEELDRISEKNSRASVYDTTNARQFQQIEERFNKLIEEGKLTEDQEIELAKELNRYREGQRRRNQPATRPLNPSQSFLPNDESQKRPTKPGARPGTPVKPGGRPRPNDVRYNIPLTRSPFDELEQLTQARDIYGNEIKTADMLTSGGVKLQQNQRAEKTKKDFGGLQFRNIGGKLQVVGRTPQPGTTEAEPPSSMGQTQPPRPSTPKPAAKPAGMR